MTDKNYELSNRIDELNAKLESESVQLSDILIKYQYELSEKQQIILEKQEEISILEKQLKDSQSEQIVGASQIDKKDEIISELKLKISTQIDELLRKDKIIFENNIQIDKLRKSTDKWQEVNSLCEKQKESLKQNEETIEQLKLEFKRQNIKISEYDSKISSLIEEITGLKASLVTEIALKDKFYNGGKGLMNLWKEKDEKINKLQLEVNKFIDKDKEITNLKTKISKYQIQIKSTTQSCEKWRLVEEWKEKVLNR